jgi:hypothetical protein
MSIVHSSVVNVSVVNILTFENCPNAFLSFRLPPAHEKKKMLLPMLLSLLRSGAERQPSSTTRVILTKETYHRGKRDLL